MNHRFLECPVPFISGDVLTKNPEQVAGRQTPGRIPKNDSPWGSAIYTIGVEYSNLELGDLLFGSSLGSGSSLDRAWTFKSGAILS